MARIISIANRKGGVGKSTITALLATELSKTHKICVLECDEQKTLSKYRSMELEQFSETAPYNLEYLEPRFLNDYLRFNTDKYDVIFIDVPRFTSVKDNETLMQVLSLCDGVLVPFLAGAYEILSVRDFVEAVKVLKEYKNDNGIGFLLYGVLNREKRNTENSETIEYLKSVGLDVFDATIKDLKLFSNTSTIYPVTDVKQGAERFTPFFNEFVNKFQLK